jgi:Domain of unknown function (DUF1707)/2TM domain
MCGHRRNHYRSIRDVERRQDPSLRVSDRERDEVATLLRDHAAEGRLTAEELDERLGAALAARTGSDLDAVLADLPAKRSDAERTRRRAAARQGFVSHATTWAAVSMLLVVIWLAAGAGPFWPVWAIGFWGFAVFKHGRAVHYGRRPHSTV